MPTKSHILVSGRFWTREDWGHVALSSIIPLGVGAVAGAAFVNDRESYNWYMVRVVVCVSLRVHKFTSNLTIVPVFVAISKADLGTRI